MAILSSLRMRTLLAFIISLGCFTTARAQNWVAMGPEQGDEAAVGIAGSLSTAIDSNEVPYVAFRDGLHANRITVRKYNGSVWETLGDPGFTQGAANLIQLVIGHSGVPYVAFTDSTLAYKATVMKFDGTDWVIVGTPGFTPPDPNNLKFSVSNNDTLYVAYQNGYGGKGFMKKFDGTSWVNLGSANGFSSGPAQFLSMALDPEGTPYVAYNDSSHSHKLTVKKFNGTSWTPVGSQGFSQGQINYASIVIDTAGKPYVAYSDYSYNFKTTVMKFDGTGWIAVGQPGFTADYAQASILVNSSGMPIVSYSDHDAINDHDTFQVKIFDGSGWVDGGMQERLPHSFPGITTLLESPDGSFYLASNTGNVRIKKYDGSAWQMIGTAGITNVPAGFVKSAVSGNGILYIAYSDIDYKIKVLQYDSSNWIATGDPGISKDSLIDLDIAVRSDGTPYIVYVTQGYAVRLKYFDGMNWQEVPQSYFVYKAGPIQLVFDNNDNPVISESSGTTAVTAMVVRFNGATWDNLASFPGHILDLKSKSNKIGFSNYFLPPVGSGTSTMYKYVGSNLTSYGSIPGPCMMDLSSAGKPYALNNNNLRRMTSNSSILEATLPSGFSGLTIDISKTDTFYFSGTTTAGKLAVAKYDGSNWTYVGDPTGISAGKIDNSTSLPFPYISFCMDTSNNLFVVYISGNSIYAKVFGTPGAPPPPPLTTGPDLASGKTSELRVYPNPVTDHQIHIELTNKQAGKYTATLTDLQGRIVYEGSFTHPGGTVERTIELIHAPAQGSYILTIDNGNERISRKILIDK